MASHVQPLGPFLQLPSKNVPSLTNTLTAASLADAGAEASVISPLILKQNEDEDTITPEALRCSQQTHERDSVLPLTVEGKASKEPRNTRHWSTLTVPDFRKL